MTPEQKARREIDQQLVGCGWIVQNHQGHEHFGGPGRGDSGVPPQDGCRGLFALWRLQGPRRHRSQARGLHLDRRGNRSRPSTPRACPPGCLIITYRCPFAYESTGNVTQFTNFLDPDPRSREVFTFHRPEELVRLATLESQIRTNLRNMPELITMGSGRSRPKRFAIWICPWPPAAPGP